MTWDALNSEKHVQTHKNWWSSTITADEAEEEEQVSPVKGNGVVESCALLMLPPPREVARPEIQRNTVYGFHLGDTNLVLREFEKYGIVLKHVTGPSNTKWMRILYQVCSRSTRVFHPKQHIMGASSLEKSRSDARKAHIKNGMQINGVLIVRVKPIDRPQCQAQDERLKNLGFLPPVKPSTRFLIEALVIQVATPVGSRQSGDATNPWSPR